MARCHFRKLARTLSHRCGCERLTKFSDETRRLLVKAGYAHTEAALAAGRVRFPNLAQRTSTDFLTSDKGASSRLRSQSRSPQFNTWQRHGDKSCQKNRKAGKDAARACVLASSALEQVTFRRRRHLQDGRRRQGNRTLGRVADRWRPEKLGTNVAPNIPRANANGMF